MSPKICICIASYNRKEYVERLLRSIEIQTYRDFEVVVTDDSTNDDIGLFLANHTYSFALTYVKNMPALGTPLNWTRGIEYSKATWIKIMHDDDWFANAQSLQLYADALEYARAQHPNVKAIFAGYQAYTEKSHHYCNKTITQAAFLKLTKRPYLLFKENQIGPPSVMLLHRSLQYLFTPRLQWIVDIEGYIRLLLTHKTIYISEALVIVSHNATQVTQTCFRNPAIEIKEYLYFYHAHGKPTYQSLWAYDVWWRLLRNLGIRSLAQFASYTPEGSAIPPFVAPMIAFQKLLPYSFLQVGACSKVSMCCSYVWYYFLSLFRSKAH